MGLFSALSRLTTRKPAAVRRRTLGKFEQMEPRQMMAGDVAPQILLGAVYFEEATGDDTKGDVIEVSYVGGAAGTTLDRLTINGDKDGDGRSNGDVFFDIAAGGWGAFESVPLSVQQQNGFTITGVTVVDGGMSIVFDLVGFDAGEKLVFSIDVDEVGSASRGTSNALAEGGEFEFSKLTGEFSAVGYRDLTLNGEFLDAFDPARTAAQTATGLTLPLPNDRYELADNKIDRTAGAVAYGPQVPLALISGYVYHDRDDDGVFDRDGEGTAASGQIPFTVQTVAAVVSSGTLTFDLPAIQGRPASTETISITGAAAGTSGNISITLAEGGVAGNIESINGGYLIRIGTNSTIAQIAGFINSLVEVNATTSSTATYNNSADIPPATLVISNGAAALTNTNYLDVVTKSSSAGKNLNLTFVQGSSNGIVGSNGTYTLTYTAGSTLNHILAMIETLSEVDAVYTQLSTASVGTRIVQAHPAGVFQIVGYTAPAGSEEGIAGVTLELLDANGAGTGITKVTNSSGFYEFRNLEAGIWGVREVQPVSWLDGKDTVGNKGGLVAANDKLTGATLAYGDHGKEYNFGELKPASIGGRVGAHKDGDCDFDEPDVPLAGVQIDLLDKNGVVIRTTTTDSEGRYKFDGLTPGTYSIVEHQPAGYYDGPERAGTAGGIVTNDKVSNIYLGSDVRAVNYDFCEHIGANLSGYVYHDRDDDGVFDRTTGEEPIAGVTLKLLRADGSDTGQRAVTDANGFYQFTNLDAGTYAVAEVQPGGWLDGKDTPGNLGGTAAVGAGADQLSGIVIVFGQDGVQYNFGELKPASIRGTVGAHKDGDCDFDEPEMPLSGVRIELLDASGNLISFTTTNLQGEYAFEGLRPGTYQIREIQPNGFYDGPERAGSAGGNVSNDLISAIYLGSDVNAVNYDFCEHIGSNLSGYVYHDRDDDGVFDRDTEEPISGVVLKLLRGDGTDTGLRVTTYTNGYYQFTNLDAGKYIVMEVQPAGWVDGKDTPGNLGGIADTSLNGDMIREIMLTFGVDGVEYNFGELKLGSISGRVHQSIDPNCEVMPGDPPIAGVKIELLNSQGVVIAQTFTNANGEYRFDGLRPGTYGVRETQPAGYFDGFDTIGSGGGVKISNDNIIDIPIRSDEHLIHYDFCEVIPAKLSGYVFIDGAPITTLGPLPADLSGIRDGQRTPDDTPLAGVWLELRPAGDIDPIYGTDTRYVLAGTYGPGPIRVQTDANGYYEFTGLAAAVYTVVQIQPPNLIDGIDTPGTLGGQAINLPPAPGPGGLTPINQFLVDAYGNNVITQIPLTPGANSRENNFSEVRQQPLVLPPPPTPPLPPPTPPTNPLAFRNPLLPGLVPPPRRPEDIFGGSSAVGYTWHLSVVNAGQPRAMTMKQLAKQFSTASFDAASWEQKRMDGAEWALLTDTEKGEKIERFFGDPNGIPVAGDWNGDGATDIGVFIDGEWLLDLNGNGKWDRGDLWAQLGSRDDQPVTGDWDGDGKTDIGIYGPAWPRDPHAIEREPGLPDADNHPSRLADKYKNVPPTEEDRTSGARVLRRTSRGEERADRIDHVFHYGTPGDAPVAGDWNGDGIRAIGIFRDGLWTLDLNGDGVFDEADKSFTFGQAGDVPIVGDFDGNGVADLAVYRAGRWIIDTNGDRAMDARDRAFELGGADGKPITGDWDGDGDDDPAVVTPRIARKSA